MTESSPQELIGYRRIETKTFLPGAVEVAVRWEYAGETTGDGGPAATVASKSREPHANDRKSTNAI